MDNKYLKNPIILAVVGSLIYYLIERFDCYINARKTASLNRRTVIVFLILVASLYFITMEEKNSQSEMFTDIANF
jgi:hypothetical protein